MLTFREGVLSAMAHDLLSRATGVRDRAGPGGAVLHALRVKPDVIVRASVSAAGL